MQIFIYPQATPQAMPQAFSQNFRNFQNFSPRRHAFSILLHNICPQAMPKFAYAKFLCLSATPGGVA
ncbi:hypothetical protein T4C_7573 [Trichinella pseudospiralis]|uniref:Uncharacterized protein n=1 Tax=Trichinella pseudospiralis TaxID=6337 RepID=A0A0V1GBM6_TRIPS|nr:hypothetical protein T4C_7573 [Trichinella pseudospiralis]